MDKLRECPFGCKNDKLSRDVVWDGDLCFVMCSECGANGPSSKLPPTAIEAWDARPSPWRSGVPEKEGVYIVIAPGDGPDEFNRWWFTGGTWNDLDETGSFWMDTERAPDWWMPIPPLPDKGE